MRRCDGLVNLRASEVEEVPRAATLLLRLVGPVADSGLLRKYQTVRTRDHVVFALDAVVKRVANSGIGMGEVTVHSRTMLGWLRFLWKQ